MCTGHQTASRRARTAGGSRTIHRQGFGRAVYSGHVRFGVLGPLTVWTSGGVEVPVAERKVRTLLAALLVHSGHPVSTDRLVESLWGERPPGNPSNTLQTKISQLRRTLEHAGPGGRDLVAHRASGYLLRVAPESVDSTRFRTLLADARRQPELRRRVELLTDALALWRGAAYVDVADAPFAAPAAQRLEEERLSTQEDLVGARLELGEHTAVVGELQALVAEHPLRERLHALQMRALYRVGRQGEALEVYTRLRQLLIEELGVEPGPELHQLHQAILRQEPELSAPNSLEADATVPDDSVALAVERSPTRPRGNLPTPVSGLVGRARECAEIRTQVSHARLVTLTGPGGVGKTRLAVEVAQKLAAARDGGVWLVEFAGVHRTTGADGGHADQAVAEQIVETVAATLDIHQVADAPASSRAQELIERVVETLRDAGALLVLDNCEHVAAPVARLAHRLLRTVPDVRLLVTSREPLGLGGEVLYAVPSLEVPESEPGEAGGQPSVAQTAASPSWTAAEISDYSAVQLFVERAGATAPGFALGEGNAAAVAQICRRLDGIPLALELAATRVRSLGAHELLSRLDDRFRLLSTGYRDAPPRQRTLRAMIDWSWELLGSGERAVLRRLAVHAEGCTLQSAEVVCAGDGVPPGAVVDLLDRLVDRSLVTIRDPAGPVLRYRLLESVAEYGRERLGEAGETERVAERHSEYYCELAERAAPELCGTAQRDWLHTLDCESANLAAAWDTALRQHRPDRALRIVEALMWYWFLRGRYHEALRRLRHTLDMPAVTEWPGHHVAAAWRHGLEVLLGVCADGLRPELAERITEPWVRARVYWFLGYVATTLGETASGERCTGQALEAIRADGDEWVLAATLSDRASQLKARGHMAAARDAAERSAELFESLGDRWGQVQAAFAVGVLAEIAGDYQRTTALFRESVRHAEELGLWTEMSYQLSWLGRTALLTGDIDHADELHERARAVAAGRGFTPGEMYAVTGLGLGARRRGDLETAATHMRTVLNWHRAAGLTDSTALPLAELGFIAEQSGDVAGALSRHGEGYDLAKRSGDVRAVALALEGFAGAYALAGEPRRAARLLGAATAARESVGTPLPPGERGDVDRISATVRDALGEPQFAMEFGHGPTAGDNPGELIGFPASFPDQM